MISIRFSQSYAPSLPPVMLRFAGNEEPTPAWPILLPNLLNAKVTCYQTPVINSSYWLRTAGERQRRGLALHYGSVRHLQHMLLPNALNHLGNITALNAETNREWNLTFCPVQHVRATQGVIRVAWSELALESAAFQAVSSTTFTYQLMHMLTEPEQLQALSCGFNWLDYLVGLSLKLPYGPAPARWVCSSKYEPVRGGAKIRFGSTSSSLTINFDVPAQVCQWNEGGGYKNAHDVLPVIDFTIPIEPVWRRSYVMQPTITCERLSDGQSIAISQISISKRRGNFAQAFSLTFQSKIDMDRAKGQPLKVVINGYEFRVILEQCSTSRAFGSVSYQGQGRSLVALLAAPYQLATTYANPTTRTLLGVLSDLLDGTGWTVNAQGFNDFTLPVGTFSIQGKAPIEAIATQLDGLGVMLQANDITKEIKLLPKWPVVPWQMHSQNPAIVFHEGVIQSLSESEDISPLCNGVHVRGEQVGISAHVKRQGTAGDVTSSDISHPLIVSSVAAQLCGTAALSDSGRKRQWNLTAPVMATLPIASEGQLIGIRDELNSLHKAMVDSWSVTASVSADGAITVKQSITALEPLEV